jgi:hypothetical protein
MVAGVPLSVTGVRLVSLHFFNNRRNPLMFLSKNICTTCNGHKRPRAAGLLWRTEEMNERVYHVIKGVLVCLNVMYNKYEWWWRYNGNSTCTSMLLRKFRREKTLGEMWAAVNKTINNLLRTAWLRTRAPDWWQSRSQLMLRKGPCWTYSRGASRRR